MTCRFVNLFKNFLLFFINEVETNVSSEFSDVELDQMMSMLECKEETMKNLIAKNAVKVACEVGESHLKDSDAIIPVNNSVQAFGGTQLV